MLIIYNHYFSTNILGANRDDFHGNFHTGKCNKNCRVWTLAV